MNLNKDHENNYPDKALRELKKENKKLKATITKLKGGTDNKNRVSVRFKGDNYLSSIVCDNAGKFNFKPGNRWEFTDLDNRDEYNIPVESVLYMIISV